MLEFIKMFGLGIVYTILLPFIVVYFVLFLLYTFFNYLICEVYTGVMFFFGGGCTMETELDKRLMKKKNLALLDQAEVEAIEDLLESQKVISSSLNDKEGGIF